MTSNPKYYIIDAAVLPEVFRRVAEAKRLLETGEAPNVSEAAKRMEISRSVFYKYRDAIFPFQNLMAGRIITFQLMLHDEPGALSALLTIFDQWSANILTINQIIPTNGCAMVTITAETGELRGSLEELLRNLRDVDGVLKAEVLAG